MKILKNLKSKKGSGELIAFFVVVAVTATIVSNIYPGLTGALSNSMKSVGKTYNSTDTIILD